MDMNAGAARHMRGMTIASLVTLGLVLLAYSDMKESSASQTAARSKMDEITVHPFDFPLRQQRGLTPEPTDAGTREILGQLIDQEQIAGLPSLFVMPTGTTPVPAVSCGAPSVQPAHA